MDCHSQPHYEGRRDVKDTTHPKLALKLTFDERYFTDVAVHSIP